MAGDCPLPDFFDPDQAFDADYRPDPNELASRATEWAARAALRPAHEDDPRTALVIVDAQFDFSFPAGALYVAGRSGKGAMEANGRLAEFLYRNADRITRVDCSLDTHHPYQVFHPAAHLDAAGRRPAPFTIITAERYAAGTYRADSGMARALGMEPDALTACWAEYCRKLEETGKYQLCVWPYHCLRGTRGHALAGAIQAAWFAHKLARETDGRAFVKGESPFTEWYSIFGAEVTTGCGGAPISGAALDTAYLDELFAFDKVIFAGLASSHCVKASVESVIGWAADTGLDLRGRAYLLRDCTAPVVVPGADYTGAAEAAFEAFAAAGVGIVGSAQPEAIWAG